MTIPHGAATGRLTDERFSRPCRISATLRTLLRDRMELPAQVTLDTLLVTISTPHAENPVAAQPATELPRVNLFMYQVSENAALKN